MTSAAFAAEVKYCLRCFMLFLIALVFALITAFLLDKPMKKCPAAFYITAAVLTVASVAVLQSDIEISSRFVREYVIGIFSRGALGAAFWAVVMWAGALPNGSAPIKKLMPIRGELSITAAILTLSHVITYGIQYISNFVKGRTGSDFVLTSIVSLVMVLIMIPLTVMSFKAVRRKMNAKTWKKIQRTAYIFYALIYVHILVLFVPKAQQGREGYFLSVLVYSAVFVGYAVMRIRKYYVLKKKPESNLIPNIVCACAVIVPLSITGVFSYERSSAPEKTVASSAEAPAVFTFEPATTAPKATTAVTAVSSLSTSSATDKKTETEVTSTASSADKTETTAVTSSETVTTTAETAGEEKTSEEVPEQHEEPAAENHVEDVTEPAVTYKYKNGEYTASAEGYAGKVHVKMTIENDTITSISAWADDDDPEYFNDAMNKVIPQIAGNLSADVDACSGATYSSKGIMEAAKKALEQAMN